MRSEKPPSSHRSHRHADDRPTYDPYVGGAEVDVMGPLAHKALELLQIKAGAQDLLEQGDGLVRDLRAARTRRPSSRCGRSRTAVPQNVQDVTPSSGFWGDREPRCLRTSRM